MDPLQAILDQIIATGERVNNNRRGQVATDLAIITLLLDAGVVTLEQVCERLEQVRLALGESYRTEEAKKRTQPLIDWLQANAPREPRKWTPEVIEGGKDQD